MADVNCVRANTRGYICRRCFDCWWGRAWGSSSGIWKQCRGQHQMTRPQTIRMKMATSLLKMPKFNSTSATWWVYAESIYRYNDSRGTATYQTAVLWNTLPCQLALHARACSVQLGTSSPEWGLALATPTLKISFCWSWTNALFSELKVAAHVLVCEFSHLLYIFDY